MATRTLLEVVVESAADARNAEAAGADRFELVQALDLGGLTPSIGLVRAVRAVTAKPVIAMVRPRSGGFAYDADELRAMELDAEALLGAGADGLVFGVLRPDGTVDRDANARLVAHAGGRPCVFHRAFDAVPDHEAALETLIDLGFARVLTSGGAGNAEQAAPILRSLADQAHGRIEILPGGGIRANNAAAVVRQTGIAQVHVAPRIFAADPSLRANPTVRFGSGDADEGRYPVCDADAIRAIREALDAEE